jgi:hypothetical protein
MLFPLDLVAQYLTGIFPGLERDGAMLRWSDRGGVSSLQVEAIDYQTPAGLTVSEVVTLLHRSAQLLRVSAETCSQLNRWAALGALLAGTDGAEGMWASKVGIFANDQSAAERMYAPLLSGQASVMGWHSQCVARGVFKVDAARYPLAKGDEVPPVAQSEFEAAKAVDDALGLAGQIQPGAYAVGLPRHGRTSALYLRSNERHSLYGNGVLSTLELPIPLDRKGLAQLTDRLNRWELSGPDLPPRLGAWCLGQRAPTYISFIPNLLCVPGVVTSLVAWGRARHARVCQWLEAEGAAAGK